jgi:hypothetical protein
MFILLLKNLNLRSAIFSLLRTVTYPVEFGSFRGAKKKEPAGESQAKLGFACMHAMKGVSLRQRVVRLCCVLSRMNQ